MSASLIAYSLAYMFTLSLKQGIIPDDWKIAKVTPAYKEKGEHFSETNYRPLSVVGHIAKNIETSVKNQLVSYLHLNSFITDDQSAYIMNNSTTTCLHRLVDDILENTNNNDTKALGGLV